MDFSPQLDIIYTKNQSIELIRVLDDCISCGFKNGDQNKRLKEMIPHAYYAVLRPLLQHSHWRDLIVELRNIIIGLPVMTMYTPYTLSEKTTEGIVAYVREHISSQALVNIVQKRNDAALSIEWQGAYGEF